jgi:hypothetical protein
VACHIIVTLRRLDWFGASGIQYPRGIDRGLACLGCGVSKVQTGVLNLEVEKKVNP